METLYFGGERYSMATEPLESYIASLENKLEFNSPNTACWRGYYGTWEIKDNRLFLIGLRCYVASKVEGEFYNEAGMDLMFPDQNEVFAKWFTGEIRIPQGDLLNYVHGGYCSKYEIDLFLEFKDGNLVGKKTVDNQIDKAKRIIYGEQKDAQKLEPKTNIQPLTKKLEKVFWKKRK
jgi:hypothetical protein